MDIRHTHCQHAPPVCRCEWVCLSVREKIELKRRRAHACAIKCKRKLTSTHLFERTLRLNDVILRHSALFGGVSLAQIQHNFCEGEHLNGGKYVWNEHTRSSHILSFRNEKAPLFCSFFSFLFSF